MKEFLLPSKGKGAIHCCKWEPSGEVRGVVQIVHGIAEYAARYSHLATYLTQQGFVVAADDHMGHGGSVDTDTIQGYFYGGWLKAVDDTYGLFQKMKAEYPDKPYFLFGHSMGSFMARTLLYRYPDAGFSGALISGTGWQPNIILSLGLAVCKMQARKHGDTGVSGTVKKLMFGGYNKHFDSPRTEYDWLSRDSAVVDNYISDPQCGFDATIGLSMAMLSGMKMNEERSNLSKMPKNLPVYIFSGNMDPVGNNGKGVRQTFEAFKRAGMEDVSLKLYPGGRHEMHNELNRDEVYQDILTYLEQHAKLSD